MTISSPTARRPRQAKDAPALAYNGFFDDIDEKKYDSMLRLARKAVGRVILFDTDCIDDIIGDAAMRVSTSPSYKETTTYMQKRSYFATAAERIAIDYLRKKRKYRMVPWIKKKPETLDGSVHDADENLSPRWDIDQRPTVEMRALDVQARIVLREELRDFIQGLPPARRAVLELRLNDYEYRAISDELRMPLNTVKGHIHQVRQTWEKKYQSLREQGIFFPDL
jgi:RNA polymerase sigma factor (sigma-70 family)